MYIYFSGSHCRRRLTGWVLMLWPSCLLPVSCGVLTALTLYRVYRTLARPLRKTSAVCMCGCILIMYDLESVYNIVDLCFSCVELIICEQVNKYRSRMKDISTLEFAESKAKIRLTHIRKSMVWVLMMKISDWSGISSVDHTSLLLITNSCIYRYLARNHISACVWRSTHPNNPFLPLFPSLTPPSETSTNCC